MPRIIVTKVLVSNGSNACKRDHPNSGCFEELTNAPNNDYQNGLSKKPRSEEISAFMKSLNGSSEEENLQSDDKDLVVPPNKDTNGFAKTFPQRLMDMLSYKGSQGIISWTMEGDAFTIIDEILLSKQILAKFLKETKILSFIRKINRWGFKRVLGKSTGTFYNEFFLRDQPQRCLHMNCHHSLATCSEKESKKELYNSITKNYAPQTIKISGSQSLNNVQKNTVTSSSLVSNSPPRQLNVNNIYSSFCGSRIADLSCRSQQTILSTVGLSEIKDESRMAQLINKLHIDNIPSNMSTIPPVDSYDTYTKRILSSSVLAKSQYHNRIRFRSQMLCKDMASNIILCNSAIESPLGVVRDEIAQPHLPVLNTRKKYTYTAHDSIAAKILLSSRHQDTAAIQFLAKKLSTRNGPRKKNNIAARLA